MTDDPMQIQDKRVSYRIGDMWAPKLSMTEALSSGGAHFVDCIVNGTASRTGGQPGLQVVQLIETASQSMRHNGETVYLPSKVAP